MGVRIKNIKVGLLTSEDAILNYWARRFPGKCPVCNRPLDEKIYWYIYHLENPDRTKFLGETLVNEIKELLNKIENYRYTSEELSDLADAYGYDYGVFDVCYSGIHPCKYADNYEKCPEGSDPAEFKCRRKKYVKYRLFYHIFHKIPVFYTCEDCFRKSRG